MQLNKHSIDNVHVVLVYIRMFFSGNLPKFTIHPENVVIDLINNITNVSLNCSADGISSHNLERKCDGVSYVSSYSWEKQHGVISSSAIGANSGSLTLVNLQTEDGGYYRCKATNGSGSSYSKYGLLQISG